MKKDILGWVRTFKTCRLDYVARYFVIQKETLRRSTYVALYFVIQKESTSLTLRLHPTLSFRRNLYGLLIVHAI
jgi:hypothetical protein